MTIKKNTIPRGMEEIINTSQNLSIIIFGTFPIALVIAIISDRAMLVIAELIK